MINSIVKIIIIINLEMNIDRNESIRVNTCQYVVIANGTKTICRRDWLSVSESFTTSCDWIRVENQPEGHAVQNR